MSRDLGYPSTLIHPTPYGPCILKLSWAGPGDECRLPAPPTTGSADAPAIADLTCPRFTIDDYSIYSGYAEARITEADLAVRDLTVHFTRVNPETDRRGIPPQHEQLWWAQAATVLTELVTREYFELLRRADGHRALKAARRRRAHLTASLQRATDRERYYEIRTAVLALENPEHRDMGLRLARGWPGSADELLTVIAATTQPTP